MQARERGFTAARAPCSPNLRGFAHPAGIGDTAFDTSYTRGDGGIIVLASWLDFSLLKLNVDYWNNGRPATCMRDACFCEAVWDGIARLAKVTAKAPDATVLLFSHPRLAHELPTARNLLTAGAARIHAGDRLPRGCWARAAARGGMTRRVDR
jgi:hypothetical protein